MFSRRIPWFVRGAAMLAAGFLLGVGTDVLPTAAAGNTLFVAPAGKTTGADTSCATARYASIQAAIMAAVPGETVAVCPGTYRGAVLVLKPVILTGEAAMINAAGHDTGITVVASGTTVKGFTVTGALGEGILVVGQPGKPVSRVTIANNVVEGNDRGNPTGRPLSRSPYRECMATGAVPGDCGEGIHLMVATHSVVSGNLVVGNAGGILLTDEFGPNAYNRVTGNTVMDNLLDCGITLASHATKAVSDGKPVPMAGGVYDNVVARNVVVDNGTVGQGAGVLLAAAAPGGAVYGNTVEMNTISGNGMGGVTLHSHGPNQDLNGNVITENTIGINNLVGDMDFAPHIDKAHTGITVGAAPSSAPVTVTITDNRITDDTYGVWHTGPVTINGLDTDTFTGVQVTNALN